MLTFKWLWAFSFLPLPWLVHLLLPAMRQAQQVVLRVPHLDDFSGMSTGGARLKSGRLLLIMATLAWVFLVTAVARPQWSGDAIELPVSGRDLMLAVDLSGSMEIEDFVLNKTDVNRLTAIKAVAGEFIERRVGDRLGLILFGRQAYLQSPLTFDRETVRTLLYEALIGMAGKETAIGDAIGLAVKRLGDLSNNQGRQATALNDDKASGQTALPGQQQVLILLTDGANTAGEVAPVKAAEFAAQQGLKIYTIGIGAEEKLVRSLFGTRRINPSSDLDEKTLTEIADKTGGRYFRARNINELNQIYQEVDRLEPVVKERQSFRPVKSLYTWPLAISMLLMAAVLLSMMRRSNVGSV